MQVCRLTRERWLLCQARLTFALCCEQTELECFFGRKGGTEQDLVRQLVGEPEIGKVGGACDPDRFASPMSISYLCKGPVTRGILDPGKYHIAGINC
jgi:hypothetical protein